MMANIELHFDLYDRSDHCEREEYGRVWKTIWEHPPHSKYVGSLISSLEKMEKWCGILKRSNLKRVCLGYWDCRTWMEVDSSCLALSSHKNVGQAPGSLLPVFLCGISFIHIVPSFYCQLS